MNEPTNTPTPQQRAVLADDDLRGYCEDLLQRLLRLTDEVFAVRVYARCLDERKHFHTVMELLGDAITAATNMASNACHIPPEELHDSGERDRDPNPRRLAIAEADLMDWCHAATRQVCELLAELEWLPPNLYGFCPHIDLHDALGAVRSALFDLNSNGWIHFEEQLTPHQQRR